NQTPAEMGMVMGNAAANALRQTPFVRIQVVLLHQLPTVYHPPPAGATIFRLVPCGGGARRLAARTHGKKRSRCQRQRPKRVGYWKASICIVQPGLVLVNRSFWRKIGTFDGSCRPGGRRTASRPLEK